MPLNLVFVLTGHHNFVTQKEVQTRQMSKRMLMPGQTVKNKGIFDYHVFASVSHFDNSLHCNIKPYARFPFIFCTVLCSKL